MARANFLTPAGSRLMRAACLVFILLLFGPPAMAGDARFLDYLYVEANEGDSSGGHAALRFDRYTFHFQHESSGLIHISRYDSDAFDYVYAKLGNRPIHLSRIAVTVDTYRFVEDTFTRFLLIQDAQLEVRDALGRDVRLLASLLAQRSGAGGAAAAIPLPAAGYFLSEVQATPAGVPLQGGASPALLSLRRAVAARYGERFLEERIARLLKDLAAFDLKGAAQELSGAAPDAYPGRHASGASRLYERAFELVALSVLQGAPPLQSGSYWQSDDDALALTAREVTALAAYGDRLERDLVRLIDSRRSDRAFPMLVGMARLCAVRESVATRRLVVLDSFGAPPDAAGEAERPYLGELERELRQVLQARRAEFFAAGGDREANYASLERAANLLLEVERAGRQHGALRRPPTPIPAREARVIPYPPAGADEALLRRELGAAQEAERAYLERLKSQYAYHLVGRNCVTELFTVLNRSMAELCQKGRRERCTDEQVREESVRRLGGYLDGTRGLVFIPFVSAGQVSDRYRVAAVTETPSYRQEKMALMREKEGPLSVFLRESNTLTSTIYRPGPDDSFFLFFTDNAGVLRPLFGAFNLLAGLGQTLYGVATLPVHGTRHVVSGVKGVFFSVPELFFVNIRKGSIGYVERAEPSAPGAGEPKP